MFKLGICMHGRVLADSQHATTWSDGNICLDPRLNVTFFEKTVNYCVEIEVGPVLKWENLVDLGNM